MSPKKTWSLNFILIMSSIIFSLILIEIILRFTHHRKLIEAQQIDYFIQNYYKPDKIIGFDISKNFPPVPQEMPEFSYVIWSNELGCFDSPYHGERDFILLIGDSFTWGYTDFEHKWGTLIEKEMNIRVLKCGVSGYGTRQEKLKLEKILRQIKRTPKLIIVGYFFGNDVEDDYLFPRCTLLNGYLVGKVELGDIKTGSKIVHSDIELAKQSEDYNVNIGIKGWLRIHSITYNFIRNINILRAVASKLGMATVEPTPTEGILYLLPPIKFPWVEAVWEEHFHNLKDIRDIADRIGSKLLIVLIPSKEQVYPFLRPDYKYEDWDFARTKVSTFLAGEKIDFIDLTQIFQEYADLRPKKLLDSKRDLYWSLDDHFNIRGNKLAALAVERCIIEKNLIAIQNADEIKSRITAELNEIK